MMNESLLLSEVELDYIKLFSHKLEAIRKDIEAVKKDLYYGSSSQTCADTLQLINETMVDELIENIDFFHRELMLHVEGDE